MSGSERFPVEQARSAPAFVRPLYQTWVKPAGDFVLAAMLLVVTFPVIALAALAIWIESGRPLCFAQRRVGHRGQEFRLLKLRSMTAALENPSIEECVTRRPRKTRVGRVIRAFRIDELPQLWNVLRGDMSFVGPRPLPQSVVDAVSAKLPGVHDRHIVKPGMFSLAFIVQKPSFGLEFEIAKARLDIEYVERVSAGYDLWIVLNAPMSFLRLVIDEIR